MAGRFSIEAVFKAVDRVTAPISRMQNRVSKFTRKMQKGLVKVNRLVNKMGRGLKKAGAVAAISLAIVSGAMTNVALAGADFEQSITNVGAVMLQTRDQIAPLEEQARQLGRTTKFTATQSANAMEILARAGFNTQQILKATPAILDAAAASGLDIAEVADITSNALKGMGLEIDQAGRVADVLALASAKTNSTMGTLGESIKNVASTARQVRIPFEEMVASVALLQDVGLDASVAGTAFNTMLTKMAAPSKEMQGLMRRFGIAFKDAKGDMLPLQDVLQQLNVATEKSGGNFNKIAFLAELVGLRGQKAASNLGMLFETGRIEELTKQLNNAAGSAKAMADIRMDTVRGSFTLLNSAIDSVKVSIFDLESGPLKDLIDGMTEWVSVNEDLIVDEVGTFLTMIKDNFEQIVVWAKRIGVGFGVFVVFAGILKTFIGIMTAVNLVMALNPIGLIVIGIGLAIAAIAAMIVWWDELKAAFRSLPEPLKVAIKLILGPLGLLVDALMLISDLFDDVGDKEMKTKVPKNLFIGAEDPFGLDQFGDDDEEAATGGSQIVSPQDRTARSIEERRSTSTAEVTIRDESGRAEVTGGRLGPGLQLATTGGF